MPQPTVAGRYLNMDWVRYVLSMAVVVAHYNILTGQSFLFPISSGAAVGIFFGLSGFLVYASYEHSDNFRQYLSRRAHRILPPYLFVVIACAIGFSSISTLTPQQYFTDAMFWKYLLSNLLFLNFLQPELPGVFEQSTVTAVNGSLWTLKVEWMLYLSIPIFCYIVRRFRCAFDGLIVAIFISSVAYHHTMERLFELTGNELYHILSYQFAGQMVYFYTGVLVFRHLNWVSTHRMFTFVSCCLVFALARWMECNLPSSYWLSAFLSFVMPFTSVCIALVICISRPFWGTAIRLLGNCSYEMYLFHFPIIQLFVLWAFPTKFAPGIAFALLLSVVFAISFIYSKGYPLVKRKIYHEDRN